MLNSSGTTPTTPGFFQGAMDESRIWNVVRTPSEIAATKNTEITSGTGLIARYGMNEGTGSAVANSIVTRASGTTVASPTWVDGFPSGVQPRPPPACPTAPCSSTAPTSPSRSVPRRAPPRPGSEPWTSRSRPGSTGPGAAPRGQPARRPTHCDPAHHEGRGPGRDAREREHELLPRDQHHWAPRRRLRGHGWRSELPCNQHCASGCHDQYLAPYGRNLLVHHGPMDLLPRWGPRVHDAAR